MVEERNQTRAKKKQHEKIKNIKRAASAISRDTYKMLNKERLFIFIVSYY